MAFYKDMEKKTRQQKRDDAVRRGGFDDEGSRYGKSRGAGSRPQGGKSFGGPKREFGNDRGFGGERKPYGDRPQGGKSFGPKREFGENRGFGGERKPYGDRPQGGKSFGPKREFGENRGFSGERKPYGDRPQSGKSFGPKREFGNDRGFGGERKPYGDRPGKNYGGPKREFGENRGFGGERKPYGDRPGKSFDGPRHDFDRKPAPRRPEHAPEARGFEKFRYEAPAPASYEAPMTHAEPAEEVPAENLLSGRNPIREALKSGRDIEKLLVAKGELSGSAREIVAIAHERHIPIQEVDRARLDDITPNHQGMLAFASAYNYSTVEKMLQLAEERGEEPFLILLDSVTDPHNLGAVIRSAECAGAHGVIVQERRAVGLTPAAVKASAGAVEYIPVARVTNLGNTIQDLQARNIWVYAADMSGEDYAETDLSGAVALVIGAEGEGVSRRVLELCDKSVSLPIKGHVDSLNASVAAGILMYAVAQARR